MEAISTSVSSINVPKRHRFYHLKPPLLLPHQHLSSSTTTATTTAAAATGKPPTFITTKPYLSTHHKFTTTKRPSTSQQTPFPIHTDTHRNAATGYAAALIDAALCKNSLDAFRTDVKRLLKWLKNNEMLKDMITDPSVEEGVKGRVIKELSEKAKLRRQVVAVVKMLVAKNKSAMVVQVMEEFERIYLNLNSGLPVVC